LGSDDNTGSYRVAVIVIVIMIGYWRVDVGLIVMILRRDVVVVGDKLLGRKRAIAQLQTKTSTLDTDKACHSGSRCR
jgi:hypothetical protein